MTQIDVSVVDKMRRGEGEVAVGACIGRLRSNRAGARGSRGRGLRGAGRMADRAAATGGRRGGWRWLLAGC
jgi:hypothetical protein